MKQFIRDIEDIESDGHYAAAEVLLIGLKHIKKHQFSHPMDMTPEQWNDVVDELIWFCKFVINGDFTDTPLLQQRYKNAKLLLGERFDDIWC